MRLRRVEWTFLLTTAIVLAACQSFRAELEEAQRLRQAGEPERARRVALGIIEQKPRQTAAWLSLIETDFALAKKARSEDQPDTASLYLWEAARIAIAHGTDAKLSRGLWRRRGGDVLAAIGEDVLHDLKLIDSTYHAAKRIKRTGPQTGEDESAYAQRLSDAQRDVIQILRRFWLYAALDYRLIALQNGIMEDAVDLQNEVGALTKICADTLQLGPGLTHNLTVEMETLLDQDFKRLLVARTKLGGIPLEIFLDMPLEIYRK